jgi:hypothetical protein
MTIILVPSFAAPALLALSTVLLFVALGSDAMPVGSCGTETPSRKHQLLDQARMLGFKKRAAAAAARPGGRKLLGETCEELTEICDQCVNIQTYFHFLAVPDPDFGFVLPHPIDPFDFDGDFSALQDTTTLETMLSMAQDNVDLVNRLFQGTPFRFTFMAEEYTISTEIDWTEASLNYTLEMTEALGKGGLETLNVYMSYQLDGPNVLGLATFPSHQGTLEGEGVWLMYDVLTGGGFPNNDLGYTLAHEIGHWLGLYHTFENSLLAIFEDEVDGDPCSDSNTNDFVDDTGVHVNGNEGFNCTDYLLAEDFELPDTCPGLELIDPFFNIMNYVDDEECYDAFGDFTCGQIERMWLQWYLYRDVVSTCDDDEMLVDIVVRFHNEFSLDNSFYLSAVGTEERIFDSVTDHDACSVGYYLQDTILVDLCVPRDEDYEFVFLDSYGDGTLRNPVFIVVDETFQCDFPADFGSEARALFNATSMECKASSASVPLGWMGSFSSLAMASLTLLVLAEHLY